MSTNKNNNELEIEDILHSNMYNDRFNPFSRYTMMLWEADSPIMQEDLNSYQSFIHHQFKLLGDSTLGNGTILSGMNINPGGNKKKKPNVPNLTDNEKNLLSSTDISAINSNINRSNYINSGTVDIAPQAEGSDSYPGIELFLPNDQSPKEITVSFSVTRESGVLHNINFIYTGSGTLKNELIDGNNIKNLPSDIKLNDGNPHQISATFKISGTLQPLYIIANQNLDVTQSNNTVRYQISELMVNKGDSANPWRLSSDDSGLPSQNRDQTVTISPGIIYLDGYAREFGDIENGIGKTIQITGIGTERIGVNLTKTLIRAQPNPAYSGSDLYDTTKGVSSQGERLADRIQYTVNLTYNDSNAPTIFTLVNGKVYRNNSSTGNIRLDELLAQRMYDQSGSFRVSGLQFSTEADSLDSNYGNLVIDKGVAYVMGYGVYLTEPTTIRYQIPKETDEVDDEDVAQNRSYRHSWMSEPFIHQPIVKDSVNVVGSVRVGGHALTNKDIITEDSTQMPTNHSSEIPDNHLLFNIPGEAKLPSIFQPTITSNQGSIGGGFNGQLSVFNIDSDTHKIIGAVTYDPDSQNTYVRYMNGSQVEPSKNNSDEYVYPQGYGISVIPLNNNWVIQFNFTESQQASIFGHVTGESFYVQGNARHEFTGPEDSAKYPDYRILSSNNDSSITYNALDNARLQFGAKGESGLTPQIGCTDLEVSYKYYLAQVDTLTLDKNGDFHLISGIPAPLNEARPREQSNPNTLRLGYVVLLPDTFRSNCQFSSVTRIPFAGLQDLSARVRNLELLEQNNALNQQAKGYSNPRDVNNTLNDDFTTFTTGDYTSDFIHNALDLAHGLLSVDDKQNSIQSIYPELDPSDNSYSLSTHLLMSSIHAEYRQEWQTGNTTAIPLNNASITNGSTNGLLTITPNADTYINCDGYNFDMNGLPTSIQLHNWFTYDSHIFPTLNKLSPDYYLNHNNSFGEDYNTHNYSQWSMRKETGEQTSQVGSEYTHPRTINFMTKWATPNGNGYYIKINDQFDPNWKMNLQPAGNTKTDPTNKTLSADNHGKIQGSFTLPNGIPTGTLRITLTNEVTQYQTDKGVQQIGSVSPKSDDVDVLSTTYEANGIENDDLGTVKRIYNATDKYGREIEPEIAQSVLIEQDSTLTKVDLNFANKPLTDDSNSNVLVQLRSVNADNTPTDEILAQATLPSSQIRVDGMPTTFRFDDPVFVNKGDWVAITVYSPSSSYSISISTVPMIESQDITYSTNNMAFCTSNGFNWDTPSNNLSLDFTLYRASFDMNTEIKFKPYKLSHIYTKDFDTISKLALLADYVTPDNSSLDWRIKIGYKDSDGTVGYTTVPLARRTPLEITDSITDSGELNNSYNPVTSLQLICDMNWDENNQNAIDKDADEYIPALNTNKNQHYSRVSPMINQGTIGLSVAESIFNTNKDHMNLKTYTDNNYQIDLSKSNKFDGLYLTHNLITYAPNYNHIITTFDTLNDEQSKVIPIYSFDNGETWNLFGPQSEYKNYPKQVPVDNHFVRYTYKADISSYLVKDSNNQGDFKMGLILLSDSPYHRPIIRRLTNTLTLENGYNTDNAQPYINNNSGTTYAYSDNDPTY